MSYDEYYNIKIERKLSIYVVKVVYMKLVCGTQAIAQATLIFIHILKLFIYII